MSTRLTEPLPDALNSVRTRSLFVMHLDVRRPQVIGVAAGSFRRVGVIGGGWFEGQRLSGQVLEGGSDWQILRADSATTLNVRIVLKTTDDALIGMTYPGVRHASPEVMARIDKGEVLDPSNYYLRIAPVFEASIAKYDWLNRIVAVGMGHRLADGVLYSVFEVL